PIRLTGNYGGEIMRHVRMFRLEKSIPEFLARDFLVHIRDAKATFDRSVNCHPLSFTMFRQMPWHHYALYALERSQLTVRTPYLDTELVATAFRAPHSALANSDVSLRLIAAGNSDLLKIRTDFGLAGSSNGMTAKLSRTVRSFSHRAEYAYDYGMP